jgi:1-acyl-sn-glycerol-3-phosphate acyltransferase
MARRVTVTTFAPTFYWGATTMLRGVLWIVCRWQVRGREHIPAKGACIVVCNHLNNADPPILAAGIARRRVRFMAKVELFGGPLGFMARLYGAFPVRRTDADVGALLTAERLLRDGWVLGMFPEGTRSRSGRIGRPHPGTALIALRSGVPVIPCAITGTERLGNPLCVLARPRFTVTIGAPIAVDRVRKPTEEQVSDLTEQLFGAITAMLPSAYLATYTGTDDNESSTGGDPARG